MKAKKCRFGAAPISHCAGGGGSHDFACFMLNAPALNAVTIALAVALAVASAGCAVRTAVSDEQYLRTKEEREAQYEREQREVRRERREQRSANDWAHWIEDQQPSEGPVVLERGDLVLKAAIARAQYGGSDPTRLTHLRMTEAARDLIAQDATERALDLLERAIAVEGSEGFAYLYLGYVYVRRGDMRRASGFLEQAGRLLPPDPQLRDEVRWLNGLTTSPGVGAAS